MAYMTTDTAAEQASKMLGMTFEEAEAMDRQLTQMVADIRLFQAQTRETNDEINRLSAESRVAMVELKKTLNLS